MLSLISLIPSAARCAWTSFQCCAIAYTCNGIKNCCISIKNFCCCRSTNKHEVVMPTTTVVQKPLDMQEEVAFPELNQQHQNVNLIGQQNQDSEEAW